ncbi:hypothetical protein CEP52_014226 [Fusarium oligoseptatum]|uniref:Uncharacterized protein n=1 Tax=Fusarium oligoseptatum TaxID=2604345 RepID=A0A428SNY8_9HYPO|nr:hypothetical protein CEP52_014226 [Fusarium oligoseptatum]
MRFMNTIIAYLASVSTVSAVTIRNYRTSTCKGNYRECKSIKTYDCCDKSPSRVFSSSKFLGLPPTGIGAVCREEKGHKCGRIHKSGHGLDLCVGAGNLKGSFWFDCRQTGTCNRRRGARQLDADKAERAYDTTPTAPDIVAIDDHRFYTNETTPEHVVGALLELYEADASYEDIPIELKMYEEVEMGEEEQ